MIDDINHLQPYQPSLTIIIPRTRSDDLTYRCNVSIRWLSHLQSSMTYKAVTSRTQWIHMYPMDAPWCTGIVSVVAVVAFHGLASMNQNSKQSDAVGWFLRVIDCHWSLQDGIAFAAHSRCKEHRVTAILGSLNWIWLFWRWIGMWQHCVQRLQRR